MSNLTTFSFAAVSSTTLLSFIALVMGITMLIAAVALLAPGESWLGPKSRAMEVICKLLVSGNRRQREFILRHLVGLANCLAGLLALNFGVSRGVIDPVGCAWLTYSALFIMGLVTVMLRTGLNRHFSDPSLVTVHLVFAEVYLAWGYYLGGPCRTVGMMLLFAVLLANFFTSSTKVVLHTSVIAVVLFGAVMLRIGWEERDLPNGPQIQMVHFGVLLIVLLSIYLLAHHLTRVRAISAQRKEELITAMNRIQELATRDELTRLFNRRHMHELLDIEKSRCDRAGRAFCIGMVDIDHFKRINDLHGHGIGDQVLMSVAALLTASLREADAVARWGGEEFLIMFPDTDCQMANVVLGRILKRLNEAPVCATLPQLRVTFSAGLAQFKAAEELGSTVERADMALYEAKRAGRNRIVRSAVDACTEQLA